MSVGDIDHLTHILPVFYHSSKNKLKSLGHHHIVKLKRNVNMPDRFTLLTLSFSLILHNGKRLTFLITVLFTFIPNLLKEIQIVWTSLNSKMLGYGTCIMPVSFWHSAYYCG